MSAFSNYLEDDILQTRLVDPANVYVSLHTVNPTDAATGAEISYTGYARQAIPFAIPGSGQTSNNAQVDFPAVTGASVTVAYWSIWTAASGGEMLFHGALPASKTFDVADVPSIPSGNLVITLD